MGAWVWYERLRGDAVAVLGRARLLGAAWLADGASSGDRTDPTVFRRQFADLAGAVHAAGLRVLAWVYDYLDDPAAEGGVAATAAELGADRLVLDVEHEAVGTLAQAEALFAALRAKLPPGFPLGFAPDLRLLVGNRPRPWGPAALDLAAEPWPWDTFARNCAAVLPQLYHRDFGVTPDVAFGLVDAWDAYAGAMGWELELAPIFQADAPALDLAACAALAGRRGATGYSLWRLDDAAPVRAPAPAG